MSIGMKLKSLKLWSLALKCVARWVEKSGSLKLVMSNLWLFILFDTCWLVCPKSTACHIFTRNEVNNISCSAVCIIVQLNEVHFCELKKWSLSTMHEPWVHLGLLHLEENNLKSDGSENFDFTSIFFIFRGCLYAITGLYLCSSFTDELLESCYKSQYLFMIYPILGKDRLYLITKGIIFELLSFELGTKASLWESLHTSLNA